MTQCDVESTRATQEPQRRESSPPLSIGALKPSHNRPLIAIAGVNSGTEPTDYIIPLSVLRRSGVADVAGLSTESGVLQLVPALKIYADHTVSEFDRNHPEGADIVVVPALHDPEDRTLAAWLQGQYARGATIVSICEGARVLSNAGLLKEGAAATHWYALDDLKDRHPDMDWRQDARYVQSGRIISTAGVTASIPVSLAIVEAIGGKANAQKLAATLNVSAYGTMHDGRQFKLDWGYRWLVVRNIAAFWNRERVGIPVRSGVDELGLALVADAYSRTYRSNAVALSSAAEVTSLNGIRFLRDDVADAKVDFSVPEATLPSGERALAEALSGIRARYGAKTAAFVALQLEYPED